MKNISSVLAGLITGVILLILLEMLIPKIYPLPMGMDITKADYEMKKFLVQLMPMGAKIMLLGCFVVSSFAGGFVSTIVSKKIMLSLIVGGALTIANIFNLIEIPHPLWLAITSMLMFLPFAFAGGKIGMMLGKNNSNAN